MLRSAFQMIKRRVYKYQKDQSRQESQFKGYEEHLNEIKFVDSLSNSDLVELNDILRWNCFIVDSKGRRFGNEAWSGKRSEPQVIPDERILLLNDRFDLSDKDVLEIGCFEGIHTIGLSRYAKSVTAIDARIENVVKTIVRCAFFGYHPTVFKCNIEERPHVAEVLRADLAYHVGVLYHLKDPVEHLFDLGRFIRCGLLLDTHFALEEEATEEYEVHGRIVRYKKYREAGYSDPFSGMYSNSKWLRLEDTVDILSTAGFGVVDIIEKRNERNGPRVLLIAKRG